jgi:Glycosyl transferase family 2
MNGCRREAVLGPHPVCNIEKYLAEAIRCALGQTHPQMEVVIVNDGPPDAPRRYLDRHPQDGFAMSDAWITVEDRSTTDRNYQPDASLPRASSCRSSWRTS